MSRSWIEALESRQLLAANGLVGEYFDNTNFTSLKLTRTDGPINFNWFSGAPDASMGPDHFSIRWQGKIQAPTSDTYTFIARVDDGVRLWVNNQLVIDAWTVTAPTDRVGTPIALQADTAYDIKLEYYEANGGSQIALNYRTSTQAKTLVPKTWLWDETPEPPPPPTIPNSPSGLNATAQSASTIRLNWIDNSNNESVFAIERSTNGTTFSPLTTVPAGTTSFTDGGLSAETTYYYQVSASNSAGTSDPSNIDSATTFEAPSGLSTVRINAGGPAYTDSKGNKWLADSFFTGGTASAGKYDVDNTVDDQLYYQRRYGNVTYSIPVVNGDYTLTLHMADPINFDGGKRKFDLKIEGALELDDFDIAGSGGGKSAITRRFGVTVTDGKMDVQFITVKDQAIWSGIEITPGLPAPSNQLIWQTLPTTSSATSPVQRVEARSVHVGNKLYVFGGYIDFSLNVTKRFDVLNLDTLTWSSLAPVPETETHAAVATDGVYIYSIGGQIGGGYGPGTNHSWKYHIATNTWSPFVSLPQVRSGGAVSLLNNKLYFVGGDKADRTTPAADHWVLDLDGGTQWEPLAPLPIALDHLTTVVINGKIYSVGGETGHGDFDGDATYDQWPYAFVYDPADDEWTRLADLPTGRSHAETSTFVINNKIYMIGGRINAPRATTGVIEYDPVTNVWKQLNPIPEPRHGAVGAWYNDRFILTGGQMGVGSILKTTIIGSWQFTVL